MITDFSLRDFEDTYPSVSLKGTKPFDDVLYVVEHMNGLMTVAYLAVDDDSPNPLTGFNGTGELIEFSPRKNPYGIIEGIPKETLFFLVDRFSHSGVHYSIANTRHYPYRQWDVSQNCGVYIPCDDVQAQYREGKLTRDGTIGDSNTVLDEYSKWCNGEVFGIITKQFVIPTGEELSEDSCWGYIGYKYAIDELKQRLNP